jgi:hypothetical protein
MNLNLSCFGILAVTSRVEARYSRYESNVGHKEFGYAEGGRATRLLWESPGVTVLGRGEGGRLAFAFHSPHFCDSQLGSQELMVHATSCKCVGYDAND